MYVLYFIGLLPLLVGLVLWLFDHEINWVEWVGSSSVGLLTALAFQWCLIYGMAGDQQTYSGQIIGAKHFAAWEEYYEEAVYREETTTDSEGNEHTEEVFDHWEPETRYHPDSWTDYSNIKTQYNIDQASYAWTVGKFGGEHAVPGDRTTLDHDSHMISGDPNDYEAPNTTGFNIPITDVRTWINKVKCCPSVFSYSTPPKSAKIFTYPYPKDPFHSNRLIGTAAQKIDLTLFDQMSARLGPVKKVNIIIIGFGNANSNIAHYQEAAWVGGKKNDIVICYGGDDSKPQWVYCFGWTEQALVKRNLETLVLNNGMSNDTLPLIEKEVLTNYIIKNWHKFDYLTIDPPWWSYFAMFGAMLIMQLIFWLCDAKYKDSNRYRY